jgi:hypothetical protein
MKRRNFLSSFPAAAALGSLPLSAQESSANPSSPLFYVASGSISGTLARGLVPPSGTAPLPQSPDFGQLRFTGRQRNYQPSIAADTWYPSWAADGTLYSTYADGSVTGPDGRSVSVNCQWAFSDDKQERWFRDLGLSVVHGRVVTDRPKTTSTGNATLEGDDPFNLTVKPLAAFSRQTLRYEGYYPCANLFHKGVWYVGGYYCHRWLNLDNVPITYELGGFGGFRSSTDRGQTWTDTTCDDRRPLFPETGRCSGGSAIKLGTPHFVDFGRDMEHSPDGMAYLVGHGSYDPDGICNWSSGDAISLARVRPSPEAINDPAGYEYFAGHDESGKPVWSKEFSRIAPLLQWPGGAGCTNITYHPHLKRYFGFLCIGWADGDSGGYDTWVIESRELTGPWHHVARLRGLGGQPYFVCMPSKFLQNSSKLVLFYSANWRPERPGVPSSPPTDTSGGLYSLCVAEFELT